MNSLLGHTELIKMLCAHVLEEPTLSLEEKLINKRYRKEFFFKWISKKEFEECGCMIVKKKIL
jgi:hypothetical protein